MLGVLTIQAQFVLSPQKDFCTGSEDEFQLVENMRKLSLMGENELTGTISSAQSHACMKLDPKVDFFFDWLMQLL